MDSVSALVARSFSKQAGAAFASLSPSSKDVEALKETALDVIKHTRFRPGACVLTSAMLARRWVVMKYVTPVYMVVGDLYVGKDRVFGNGSKASKVKAAFRKTNLDWDGHCWVQLGPVIADASVRNTARSKGSPPALAKYIAEHYPPDAPLVMIRSDEAAETGLRYQPAYVLNDVEYNGILNGIASMMGME